MRAYRPAWSTWHLRDALAQVSYIEKVAIQSPTTYGGVRRPAHLLIEYEGGRREEWSFAEARDYIRAMMGHGKAPKTWTKQLILAAVPTIGDGYLERLPDARDIDTKGERLKNA